MQCNGFTEIQDIIKLIAHSPEGTFKDAKYTVKLIKNFVKPNIKSFHFFKLFYINQWILLHSNGFTEFQDLIKFIVQIPTRITQWELIHELNIPKPNI